MEPGFPAFALLGFVAQMVDGAIGMAYGTISTTVLISLGLLPAAASAAVHAAEIATTAVAGGSHAMAGNVDRRLVMPLALSGALGGAVGAYLLTEAPVEYVKSAVALYLLLMGVVILRRALQRPNEFHPARRLVPLGLVGGFLDAIGGGGWGPIVTSTLLARGHQPRRAVGSVILAEFFVSLTVAGTFVATIGIDLWPVVLGLLAGGLLAAPLAAYAVGRIAPRAIMFAAAAVVILISARTLFLAL
ncbi:MAG: sulfite exporter TauE/SafE family protein, partial [Alphaproteobacteria bacterium]|nr:sulfite exporter TauE/SafE family protein [Alphaproteobacteria bacterium]